MAADNCTLWPDGYWTDCCAGHDGLAENPDEPWISSNWWLAQCVWASSYSSKADTPLKRLWIRSNAVLMFIGTSTFGWAWRFSALFCR